MIGAANLSAPRDLTTPNIKCRPEVFPISDNYTDMTFSATHNVAKRAFATLYIYQLFLLPAVPPSYSRHVTPLYSYSIIYHRQLVLIMEYF